MKLLSDQDLHPQNPYKGHKRVKGEEHLPDNVKNSYTNLILNHVLYDTENCKTLQNFELVKRNTHCTFARTAILWGAQDYDNTLTLEANVERSIPAVIKFFAVAESLHLDGFVFELPGIQFGMDVKSFGKGVYRVLKYISDQDPAGYHCMNKSFVSQIGWSFEFNAVPIFVTTFAPCYPENHSRYAFGAQNAFILLQPMYSFAIHEIGHDTPTTNWSNPQTIRDKIRVAYKENGRPYYIRDTIYYPMAHDVVKPLVEGPGNVVKWWRIGGDDEQGSYSIDDLDVGSQMNETQKNADVTGEIRYEEIVEEETKAYKSAFIDEKRHEKGNEDKLSE